MIQRIFRLSYHSLWQIYFLCQLAPFVRVSVGLDPNWSVLSWWYYIPSMADWIQRLCLAFTSRSWPNKNEMNECKSTRTNSRLNWTDSNKSIRLRYCIWSNFRPNTCPPEREKYIWVVFGSKFCVNHDSDCIKRSFVIAAYARDAMILSI